LVYLTHKELHQFSIAKRVIIPGYQIEGECEACKIPIAKSSDDIVLYYPFAGEEYLLEGVCQECETNWSLKVQINLTLTPVK
jgi:hypothetical protein